MFVLRASARKLLDFPLSRSHNSHSSGLSLGRGSSLVSYLVSMGKTHCQGHQDPSKSVPIFLRGTEANSKMVPINRAPISRLPTVCELSKPESVWARPVVGAVESEIKEGSGSSGCPSFPVENRNSLALL